MLDELFGLQGQISLVTGSSRGVGFALARGLARAGSTVVLNGIVEERLEKAVAALRGEGLSAHGVVFDVASEEAVGRQVAHVEKTLGPIGVLVNNAGIQIRAPLEQFALADWQRLIAVNLTGCFITAKAVVPKMIQRRAGKIINVCSIQCELARPTIAPYTASKGGLRNLTRGMATDWGKYNIQVNGLAPGYLRTEMTRPLYEDPEFDGWVCSRTPAGRWGEPEELVGAVIFLASQASSYMNGQILHLDGGMSICV
jgi:gluconate 5-dehydrogenase